MKKALILAALAVMAGGHAWANSGILACQMSVSAFAADAADARLSANQAVAARQAVDVGRGQCRSSPDVVEANLASLRQAFAIGSGPQTAERFDEFWPAGSEELSAVQ